MYGDEKERDLHFLDDIVFTEPARYLAEQHADRAPTYRYRFEIAATRRARGFGGAIHGSDLPYVFGWGRRRRCGATTRRSWPRGSASAGRRSRRPARRPCGGVDWPEAGDGLMEFTNDGPEVDRRGPVAGAARPRRKHPGRGSASRVCRHVHTRAGRPDRPLRVRRGPSLRVAGRPGGRRVGRVVGRGGRRTDPGPVVQQAAAGAGDGAASAWTCPTTCAPWSARPTRARTSTSTAYAGSWPSAASTSRLCRPRRTTRSTTPPARRRSGPAAPRTPSR